MVERVLDRVLDDARRLGGGQPVLGLALEFRLADEHREHAPAPTITSSLVIGAARLPWPMRSAWSFRPRSSAVRRPGLVGAAVRRRDGVAVGVEEAVGVGGPSHRPLRAAVLADLAGAAGEDVGVDERRVLQRLGEIIAQALREVERGLLRHVGRPSSSSLAHDQRISTPPNR